MPHRSSTGFAGNWRTACSSSWSIVRVRCIRTCRVPASGTRNLSVHGCPDDLLRSRFCIRWEKGLCPKQHPKQRAGGGPAAPLYLINQQNRLEVVFDCARCEMVIRVPDRSVPVPEMPQKLF